MNLNRRIFLKVCGGLLTSLTYNIMTPWDSYSAQRRTIRIGIITTLTGSLVAFGRGALQAAQIAVEEINRKGGLSGRPLELLIFDDRGKLIDVLISIKRAAHEGVVAILGSPVMFANKDVSEVAESARIPLFLLNPFKRGVTSDTGDYVFRLQPQANIVALKMITYLLEISHKKGIKIDKIGILYDKDKFWRDPLRGIITLAKKNKKLIRFIYDLPSFQASVVEMKKGFDDIVYRIRSRHVDVMVVLGYPFQMSTLVQRIRQSNVKTKAIVGFSNLAVSNPWFVTEQGRNLVNVMDANYWGNPKNPAVQNFKRKFKSKHGSVPSNDAYQAYSIIQVLKDAIIACNSTDQHAISTCLHRNEFHNHLLAQRRPIRFDQSGQNANSETVLLQVSNPVPKIKWPPFFSEMPPVFGLD